MKLRLVYKGGKGSGHYGHSGRQGRLGGSEPGAFHQEDTEVAESMLQDAAYNDESEASLGSGYIGMI